MSVQHIHDRGYKRLFKSTNFFRQLLESFVEADWVAKLDFASCTRLDKSYVSDAYKETTSDVMYQIALQKEEKPKDGDDKKEKETVYICVLLEFQSTCPRFMVVRVAHYILSFYLDLVEGKQPLKKLPPVFPIVLYNGKDNWTAPTRLADVIDSPDLLGQFALDFKYFNIVENGIPIEKLEEIGNLVSTLFLADCHYDLNKLEQAFLGLFDNELHDDILLLMDWFFHLVLGNRRTEEDYEQLKQACQTKVEAQTMLEDVIERERQKYRHQGREEGKAEGREEGKTEKALEIARNFLRSGVDIKTIAHCTGLSETEVKQLRDKNKLH